MGCIIEVDRLNHSYGDFQAIRELSFSVRGGEVFGLLGPNGAGKTTTIRLLNGLFPATGGAMKVMGFDPKVDGSRIRQHVGVLTETPALYERLTARQNLRFFGVMAGMSDAEIKTRSAELLEVFSLSDRADERPAAYSKGMKQRLALARAWLAGPKLLFLDEPTSGLDPQAAVMVRELIAGVRTREGTTVLVCTHNLDEAQRLCDRMLIMGQGQCLAMGSLEELRREISPGMWLEIDLAADAGDTLRRRVSAELEATAGVLALNWRDARSLRVEAAGEHVVPAVVTRLVNLGGQILRVQPQEISLEEVYLSLQNQQHNKGGAG